LKNSISFNILVVAVYIYTTFLKLHLLGKLKEKPFNRNLTWNSYQILIFFVNWSFYWIVLQHQRKARSSSNSDNFTLIVFILRKKYKHQMEDTDERKEASGDSNLILPLLSSWSCALTFRISNPHNLFSVLLMAFRIHCICMFR